MAPPSKTQLIQVERRKIKKEIAELEARLADLDTAERVMVSLKVPTAPVQKTKHRPKRKRSTRTTPHVKQIAKPETGKPIGIPPVPEMIRTALRESDGMEPREMVEYIRKRWWPTAPAEGVGPIAWRMYKRDDLEKRGAKYFLPTAPVQSEAAE